jgi:hypothetical protein
MKTEVSKGFNWGFLLSEQDLRRIIQTCQEHFSKLEVTAPRQLVSAKLRDGSLIDGEDVNSILSLENDGSKSIQRLKIVFDDGQETSDQHIEVQFQDGLKNSEGWTSIDYTVAGPSRDWAFLAASEIEERVRKPKSRHQLI